MEIASYRTLLGALLLGLFSRLRGEPLALPWRDLRRLAAIGAVGALNYLCFVSSLQFTTVAHTLTLTYTSPVFVGLLAKAVLREPLHRRAGVGIAGVITGTAILAGFEPHLTGWMVLGDLLALAGAFAWAIYSLVGRRERTRVPLLPYAFWVAMASGLVLLPPALLVSHGSLSPRSALAIFLLALLPLALGHTLYNAALRRLPATPVNIIATQEVTLGILLAWIVLGEAPGWNALLGAGITVASIILALV